MAEKKIDRKDIKGESEKYRKCKGAKEKGRGRE